MMSVVPDREAVRRTLETEGGRLADLVRMAPHLGGAVPGLTWTTGQVAAHVASVYQDFAATIRGEVPDDLFDGVTEPAPTVPETLSRTNDVGIGNIGLSSPAEAARKLEEGAKAMLAAIDATPDLQVPCPAPWYGPGITHTAGALAALSVSETLMHTRDIGRGIGVRTRMSAASAVVAAPVMMSEMMPLVLSEEGARGFIGSFKILFRGGAGFVVYVAGGSVWTEAVAAQKVDCVVSLDPRSALMIAHDRQTTARIVLSGGLIPYGRRPWLALKLRKLFLAP